MILELFQIVGVVARDRSSVEEFYDRGDANDNQVDQTDQLNAMHKLFFPSSKYIDQETVLIDRWALS